MRVYEVTEVRPNVGLTLRDVVSGAETRVRERSASQTLHRWDVIATRIMPAPARGEPVLDGGALPISPMRSQSLIEWLRKHAAEGSVTGTQGSLREKDLFAAFLPDIHRAWAEPVGTPSLVNFDGEPVLMTEVHFDVIDRDTLASALDRAKDIERDPADGEIQKWRWTGKGKERGELVTYGWFSLDAARFRFATNSAERGERGRKLIDRLAAGAVRYRMTTTQDPSQAMQAMARGAPDEPQTMPKNLREAGYAAIEQWYAAHYESWLDEPVPRLDDSTPRDAVSSAKLRPRVVEMLKELEAMYEKALVAGQPAFDPTWMWQELGLANDRDAPAFRKQAPVLGHESLARHLPGLEDVACDIAERIRSIAGTTDLTRVIADEDVEQDLHFQRLARQCDDPKLALGFAKLVSNFELYLRKVFWVAEPLCWMLGATKLDVTGDAVRLPFRSIALVFTDRYALSLAERMDARLPPGFRLGRMLQVLTVYVTQDTGDAPAGGHEPADSKTRPLDLTFVGDVLDGTRPSVVPCRLELADDQRIDEILDKVALATGDHAPVDGVLPLYESVPLRDLLSLVVNALLYATSPDAEVEERPAANTTTKNKARGRGPVFTSDTIFYLPGTIDITTLRRVQNARRGGREHELTRRCMVRGH